MSTSLADRYGSAAVITGASSGIGEAIARHLAAAGLDVVLVARREAELKALADELRDAHDIVATVVPLDLATTTGVDELAVATADIDVGLFVGAAGFGTSGRFVASDIDAELAMLDVNCRAIVAQTHHFAERFVARGRGGIILFSSIVGFQGMPNAAHYAATKAYVQSFAEALAVELRPDGVDVLAAAPGPTDSGFADRADMKMGSALDPERIAGPIIAALGRTSTTLPGGRSKLLRYSVAPLPRRMRVRIMGNVMAGMTKHQELDTD